MYIFPRQKICYQKALCTVATTLNNKTHRQNFQLVHLPTFQLTEVSITYPHTTIQCAARRPSFYLETRCERLVVWHIREVSRNFEDPSTSRKLIQLTILKTVGNRMFLKTLSQFKTNERTNVKQAMCLRKKQHFKYNLISPSNRAK